MFSRVMLLGVRRKKNQVFSSPLKMGRRHQNSKEKTGKGKKVKENTGKRGNMQVAGALRSATTARPHAHGTPPSTS